jgi:hypothetical protein
MSLLEILAGEDFALREEWPQLGAEPGSSWAAMNFRFDPHNDPNEAYEVVQTPAWLRGPPTNWWTVLANAPSGQALPAASEGSCNPVRHRPGVSRAPCYDEALAARRRPVGSERFGLSFLLRRPRRAGTRPANKLGGLF